MNLFYDISGYFTLLITLITMILAFTWKPRKGKWLLCTSFILSFLAAFHFRIFNLLVGRGLFEWSLPIGQGLNMIGIVLYQASNILLLCFVIVARKPSPSLPPLPIQSNFPGQMGGSR